LENLIFTYRSGPGIDDGKFDKISKYSLLNNLAKKILKSRLLPFRRVNLDNLINKIEGLNLVGESFWNDYQQRSGYTSFDGGIKLSKRMAYVRDKAKELRPRKILELAGNQGVLSRALADDPLVERVLCSDYDLNAIDSLFLHEQCNGKISMACFNFILGGPWDFISDNERSKRLRSDLVIALAVTHHLILSQQHSIHRVLSSIISFSSKYVMIEFMPLGLWSAGYAPPVPEWYNETWFVSNLSEYCDVIERKVLEENRVLFICTIKKSETDTN